MTVVAGSQNGGAIFPDALNWRAKRTGPVVVWLGEGPVVADGLNISEFDRGVFGETRDPVLPQGGLADEDFLSAATAFDACVVVVEIEDRVELCRAIGIEPIDGDRQRIKIHPPCI